MTRVLSRALMTLATGSLGESRRDWAMAMESEFEIAVEDGAPLTFAAGCLAASWWEVPQYTEGRLAIANYALALGLLLPMAVLIFGEVSALPALLTGSTHGIPPMGENVSIYVVWARLSAAPVMLVLWLALGFAHLGLAWTLVERDWSRVVKAGALIGAILLTLIFLMAILFLDLGFLAPTGMAMAAELGVITLVARSHTRLLASTSPDRITF